LRRRRILASIARNPIAAASATIFTTRRRPCSPLLRDQ
jgi:hypothetical protein